MIHLVGIKAFQSYESHAEAVFLIGGKEVRDTITAIDRISVNKVKGFQLQFGALMVVLFPDINGGVGAASDGDETLEELQRAIPPFLGTSGNRYPNPDDDPVTWVAARCGI